MNTNKSRSELVNYIINRISSRNLSCDYESEEYESFTIVFKDGFTIIKITLIDEDGFTEPDENAYDDDDSFDWDYADDPSIWIDFGFNDSCYDTDLMELELNEEDVNILLPVIAEHMKKENVEYFRPY